jgi:hypothetical protein
VNEHPWLLRSRLDDAISTVFDRYPVYRHHPLSFLSQREELVTTAAKRADVQHPLLDGFRIVPRFTLSAKIIEPKEGMVVRQAKLARSSRCKSGPGRE